LSAVLATEKPSLFDKFSNLFYLSLSII